MKHSEKRKKSFRDIWNAYKWLILAGCLCLIALAANLASLYMPGSVKGALYGDSQMAETVQGELREDQRAPEGMKLAAENEELAMFFGPSSSAVALLDKTSQNWWYSNPPEAEGTSSGSAADNLKSILQIRYYDQNDVLNVLNSYRSCVANGTFEYEMIPDGIRMLFAFEKGEISREMLPAVVAKEKFEEKILSKLSEDERQSVEKYYLLQKPGEITSTVVKQKYQELYTALEEDEEYYFLDLYAPGYQLETLYQALYVGAGYTVEEIEADNLAAGYDVAVDSFVRIEIPMEFVLEGHTLAVSIPASKITVPSQCRLGDLVVMPYFGSAGTEEKGYLFVPDGSGALIYFNNDKRSVYSYSLPIYGEDGGIERTEASFSTAKADFPAFGIAYQAEKAMLAVVEEGESHGKIEAGVAGGENDRNWVRTRFEITPMAVEEFSDKLVVVNTNLYQEEPYGGRISIRYLFTGKEEADYSGLACLYREYLKETGILKASGEEGIRFDLKLIAKIWKETSFLGIPYEKTQTVTSFSQADEIVDRLKEEGVSDINLGMTSWFGGGIQHHAVTGRVGIASFLGGKSALEQLLSEAEGYGEVGLGADLLKVYESWPRFNQFLDAARFLNHTLAVGYRFNPATLRPDERRDTFYYLSPRYFESALGDYCESVHRYGVAHLWLTDAGRVLTSDFRKGQTIDREASKGLIARAVEAASERYGITACDPNQYLWKYLDGAVDLPMKSSEHMLIDESVPFLQMVLSGHMHYASGAFNRSGDLETCFLKAVETGSDLYYEWIYEPDVEISALKGVETEEAYSMSYENWIGTATEQYRRMKEELADVEGKEITGHSRVEDGVYRTQYGEISVIVNYNEYDVVASGETVGARNFKVLR